jgi:endonuclease/exonuclease/phosphatase family metal-dependent hydrolase
MKFSLPLPVLDPRRRWAEVVEPIVNVSSPRRELSHGIPAAQLERWSQARSRRALARDPSYRSHQDTIERTLSGFDWDLRPTLTRPDAPTVDAVLWNIERGKRFEALRQVLLSNGRLGGADLYLLCEADWGMGRSANRHVPQALAEAMGMGYVFAPSHLVLSPGDLAELDHGESNAESLHGVTLLTRFPVRRVCGVPLPEYVDKFHVTERRLGWKRSLLCEVEFPDGPVTVAVVHLDPFAPPRHRARQMRIILRAIERFGNERVLLGGDLNTNTYDLGSAPGLAINVVRKLAFLGFDGTIDAYMIPDQTFERRTFRALRQAGLRTEGYTNPDKGTVYYDLNDPELVEKSLEYLPKPVFEWLQRRLEPWNRCVPLRIDWFAGRGLSPAQADVIERPTADGSHVADHNPVWVQLATQARTARATSRGASQGSM